MTYVTRDFLRFPPTPTLGILVIMASALSTVFRGKAFEERCLRLLQSSLSMTLRRVGGPSDGGIDLQGWWWLPAIHQARLNEPTLLPTDGHSNLVGRRRVRVLAQCKAEKQKMGTAYVREMEGVMHRLLHRPLASADAATPIPVELAPMIALLASESPFTKPTLLRVQSSPIPFLLLHLPPVPNTGVSTDAHSPPDSSSAPDALGSAFWNPALGGSAGLLQGKMELRWERPATGGIGRPGLWRDGVRVESWVPSAEEGTPTLDADTPTSGSQLG